eukprot:SAG31_NODE_2159_length_6302_cov_9.311140_12_plen_162_part_01
MRRPPAWPKHRPWRAQRKAAATARWDGANAGVAWPRRRSRVVVQDQSTRGVSSSSSCRQRVAAAPPAARRAVRFDPVSGYSRDGGCSRPRRPVPKFSRSSYVGTCAGSWYPDSYRLLIKKLPCPIKFSTYKAPEKQRPVGAAGAFGTGDTGGRYSTGTVLVL